MKFTFDYSIHGHIKVTVDAPTLTDAKHSADQHIYDMPCNLGEFDADLYSVECNGKTRYYDTIVS